MCNPLSRLRKVSLESYEPAMLSEGNEVIADAEWIEANSMPSELSLEAN